MTLSDSNLKALENKARRGTSDVILTRNEALALLVEVRQLRAEVAELRAQQAAGGEVGQ